MATESRTATVTIESCIDGTRLSQTLNGEYAFRDGAHLVVCTDYTGNAVTRIGMEIREDKLLLHRTGAMEGDMLFDPQEATVFRYKAFPVEAEFVLLTDEYVLEVTEEGLKIRLRYRLCGGDGCEAMIVGEQVILVKGEGER